MITSHADPHDQAEALRARLADAEETLRAIRQGEIDALVVESDGGSRVYTLHSADEPYRHLVEEMQEGAVVLTERGDVLYANTRFAALVGEPLASVVGSRMNRFVSEDDRDDFQRLVASGTGRCRSRLTGSDSGTFEVSLSLTTTASSQGNRLSLIVTDLTELLQARSTRDRAERDSRTKDDFLAMLSHELRTPLAAIGNAVQVLEQAPGGGPSLSRARDVIARQVTHVTQLINDLLDVERVVSGKIRLNRLPLDMALAVGRAVATCTDGAPMGTKIDLSTEPVWVDGDAQRLQQVLANLVTNAIKYSPPGASIRVTLRSEAGDAVLTVEDTGVGISPTLLPFIFDMYVQADRTLDHAQGGLGIGLALVRRLVELHGGTIEASSEGEGRGSAFVVRLRQIPPGTPFAAASPPLERRARPRRILVIEDNADAREMLRMMLEFAGHTVYDAPDGARGLELVNVVKPEVAIIDIGLPRMDGYEVAKRIREQPYGRSVLLLALTGYGSHEDEKRSSEYGFDHHLVKPVDPSRLASLLGERAEIGP
jgi:two-component system, sensor histidine kinase